ncbi:MAG: hypothetical protein QM811_02860 [Pirellulales bacterium]
MRFQHDLQLDHARARPQPRGLFEPGVFLSGFVDDAALGNVLAQHGRFDGHLDLVGDHARVLGQFLPAGFAVGGQAKPELLREPVPARTVGEDRLDPAGLGRDRHRAVFVQQLPLAGDKLRRLRFPFEQAKARLLRRGRRFRRTLIDPREAQRWDIDHRKTIVRGDDRAADLAGRAADAGT